MKRTCIRFLLLSVFAVMMIAFAPVKTMAATDVSNWDEFYNAIGNESEIVLKSDLKAPSDLSEVAYLRKATVLDLNGHTLDLSELTYGFDLVENLTVNDSSEKGTGTVIGCKGNGYIFGLGGSTGYDDEFNEGPEKWNDVTLTINGGTFIGHYAGPGNTPAGKAVYVRGNNNCVLNSGKFRKFAYAVDLDKSTGGNLVFGENSEVLMTENACAVRDYNNLTNITIKDKAKVEIYDNIDRNNHAVDVLYDVYGDSDFKIRTEGDVSKCRIGVSPDGYYVEPYYGADTWEESSSAPTFSRTFTEGYSSGNVCPPATCFFSPIPAYDIITENGEARIQYRESSQKKTAATWAELQAAIDDAGTTATIIKISGNGVVANEATDKAITIGEGQTIILDLNGQTIGGGSSFDDRLISNSGNLFIKTSSGKGTIRGGRSSENGAGIYNAPAGYLEISRTNITDNETKASGGGIYNEGTVSLNDDVSVYINKAQKGNGIYNDGLLRIKGSLNGGSSGTTDDVYMVKGKFIEVATDISELIIPVIMEAADVDTAGNVFTMNYSRYCGDTDPEEIFDVSGNMEDGGSYRIASNGTEALFRQKQYRTITITYYGEPGVDAPFTDEAKIREDEEGTAYQLKGSSLFTPPQGKEFDCWRVDSIDGEAKDAEAWVTLTGDTDIYAQWKAKPSVTIRASAIDGGDLGIEPYVISGIDSGSTNVFDLLFGDDTAGYMDYTKVKPEISARFQKEGYEFVQFTPKPLSEYSSWDEVPNTSTRDSDLMSQTVNADIVIYAVMAESIDDLSVGIGQPACTSDPSAGLTVTVPEGAHYKYGSTTWTDGEFATDIEEFVPGNTYSARATVVSDFGYTFRESPAPELALSGEGVTKDSDAAISHTTSTPAAYFDLSVIAKHADVQKIEAGEPATCELPGSKIPCWGCSGCGKCYSDEACTTEINREDIVEPALGHDWSDWKVTKEATYTEEGVETRTCSRCKKEETRTIPVVPKPDDPTPDDPTPTPDDPTPVDPQQPTDPVIGETYTVGGSAYRILNKNTAALVTAKNVKSFKLPASVKIKGKTFKVTQINANAFKGKKIRTVTVSKNVKTIKANAFKGSKATKMIVKTKKLTKKSVRKSLKGSKIKKIQVKVGKKAMNKKYVKKYKKIFTKKNAGKKASVK